MGQTRTVTLDRVDRSNWAACADLRVCPGQENLICTNERALAEAGVLEEAEALAIQVEGNLVGLVVLIVECDLVEIHRFMIGCAHQRQGHGRAALRAIFERVRATYGECRVIVKFLHWNTVAERLYFGAGFVDTGQMDGDEKVYALAWSAVI